MNYKNEIDMLNNEINNDKDKADEKNEIIKQLKLQIEELENEMLEKDKELNEYEENNQNEINDYMNQIEEL